MLDRSRRAGRIPRNLERAVEGDLVFAWRECRSRAGRGNLDRSYPKPIDDRIGEDRGRTGFAEHIHHDDQVLRVVRHRKGEHVRYVGGRVRQRPWS
jgi:hypothetical protein